MQIAADANRPPVGAILLVTGNQIAGYAFDPDVLPGAISIDVAIDGAIVTRIRSDQPFPAQYASLFNLPDLNHGFGWTVPDQFLDGKSHTIQMYAVNQPDGVNPELKNSPTSFVGKRGTRPYGWL